jgi:hypothetical protein
MSSSSQYNCLCLLKDIKKLTKEPKNVFNQMKRSSWLHPITIYDSNKLSRALNLYNIERIFSLEKSFEVVAIDRILCDENKHLTLRDLPSFYASANGML